MAIAQTIIMTSGGSKHWSPVTAHLTLSTSSVSMNVVSILHKQLNENQLVVSRMMP